MEMKNKFINHSRNIWERAVHLLPRVDQLCYKYIHMEEILGNVVSARKIFERWMEWQPDHHGWRSYTRFELRYSEINKARELYERYVDCHPNIDAWIHYAKFEMKNGEIARARNCYGRAVDKFIDDEEADKLYVAFAEFDERCKETERARCIYKFSLHHVPKGELRRFIRSFLRLRKSGGIRKVLMIQLCEKGGFGMRTRLGKTLLVMTLGLITFGWRKVLVIKVE